MGIGASDTIDFNSFLAQCCLEDKSKDNQYWSELITHAYERTSLKAPNPKLLNEIAIRQHENAIRLMKECVNFMEYIVNAESKQLYPKIIFNQISQVIYTFSYAIVSFTCNPVNFYLYHYALGMENDYTTEMTEEQRNEEYKNGTLMKRFLNALYKMFFKENLTVLPGSKVWDMTPNEPLCMQLLRYDLIYAMLLLINVKRISLTDHQKINFIVDTPFPSEQLFNSIFNISRYYDRITSEKRVLHLIQMSYIFCISASYWQPELLKDFPKTKPELIITAFAGSEKLPFSRRLSFNAYSPLVSECVSLFYLNCVWNREFITYIGENKLSNTIFAELISLSQYTFETIGLTIIHTIILSTIDILLLDKTAIEELKQPANFNPESKFRPHRGMYADVILEFIMNLSAPETNSLICRIIKRMLPIVSFSVTSCSIIFKFFQQVKEKDQIKMLLEGFAGAVQSSSAETLHTRVFVIQNAKLLKKFKQDYPDPTEIIIKYNSFVLPKFEKQKVTLEGAIQTLSSIKTEEIFEKIVDFSETHLMVNLDTWREWGEVLYTKANHKNVTKFRKINLRYRDDPN